MEPSTVGPWRRRPGRDSEQGGARQSPPRRQMPASSSEPRSRSIRTGRPLGLGQWCIAGRGRLGPCEISHRPADISRRECLSLLASSHVGPGGDANAARSVMPVCGDGLDRDGLVVGSVRLWDDDVDPRALRLVDKVNGGDEGGSNADTRTGTSKAMTCCGFTSLISRYAAV